LTRANDGCFVEFCAALQTEAVFIRNIKPAAWADHQRSLFLRFCLRKVSKRGRECGTHLDLSVISDLLLSARSGEESIVDSIAWVLPKRRARPPCPPQLSTTASRHWSLRFAATGGPCLKHNHRFLSRTA